MAKIKQPLVSVIVPVYNTEKYLRQCLSSLTAQTLSDIEIIVVDDGSTDNSREIIEKYAVNDKRIKPIFKENGGVNTAYQAGVEHAIGEYITFLDSDDWIDTNAYEVMYNTAKENNVDIVRAGASIIHEDGKTDMFICIPFEKCNRVITNSLDVCEFVKKHISHWASIYRHEFIKKNKIAFKTKYKMWCDDLDWAYQCWICAKSFYILPFAFVHYRRDNPNSCNKNQLKYYRDILYGHLEARNSMKALGKRATKEHWQTKLYMEWAHFDEAINNKVAPPLYFMLKISKIMKENIAKGYLNESIFIKSDYENYLLAAYHPVLFWLNANLKLWFEKHTHREGDLYYRIFGIYKRHEKDDFITTYIFGIPFYKRINIPRKLAQMENQIRDLYQQIYKNKS